MKSSYTLLLSAFLAVTLITGCSIQSENTTTGGAQVSEIKEQQTSKSLSIVTTFPPLYAHVANIIDENDTIKNLVPAGTSVHLRQPKPSDIQAIQDADIIITNGLGIEEFLDGYLEELEHEGVVVVDTSLGIQTIEQEQSDIHDEEHEDEEGEDEHHDEDKDSHEVNEDHDETEGHDHHHDGADPHVWLNPQNAIIQVETIRQALIAADQSQEVHYTQNAMKYSNTIQELDNELTSVFENSSIAPFIVFHDAYQYFIQKYDFSEQQVGLIQEFHGDNPSQRQIADLIEIIENTGVQYLFTEPQFNPSIIRRLEQETGITAREIDPIGDSIGKDGYITMIRKLADGFKQ